MSNQKVYQQLVSESDGGPRHIICTPRDPNQVKNFWKELRRHIWISHDNRRGVSQDHSSTSSLSNSYWTSNPPTTSRLSSTESIRERETIGLIIRKHTTIPQLFIRQAE